MTYKPSAVNAGLTSGPPTVGKHKAGEAHLDGIGRVWICTAGDGTGVGTWEAVPRTTSGVSYPSSPQLGDIHLLFVA